MKNFLIAKDGVIENAIIAESINDIALEDENIQILEKLENDKIWIGWELDTDSIWKSPKPYNSWLWDQQEQEWHSPVGDPVGDDYIWEWNEEELTWDRSPLPQPFESWTLDENDIWQAPSPYPNNGNDYYWDEETLSWEPFKE